MGTRFEKDSKHLKCRRNRDEQKAKVLFCTTSVSGTANHPFRTSCSLSLSHFAGEAEMTCGLIPGHDGVVHIPQPQSAKRIYLARWELILAQILYSVC